MEYPVKKYKIYPSVTTVTMEGQVNNWQSQLEEIKKFDLIEIALFPTVLEEKERYELYEALRKDTPIEKIPFVHLRTDMKPEEIDYLFENFKSEVFNLHSTEKWPLQYDYAKYAERIFIENGRDLPSDKDLENFGGLCLDFSHWENQALLGNEKYQRDMIRKIDKYSAGVCHVSVIKDSLIPNPFQPDILEYDSHSLDDMHELDYLKKYARFLPEIIAIELQNSISDQLKVKEYIENMIESELAEK